MRISAIAFALLLICVIAPLRASDLITVNHVIKSTKGGVSTIAYELSIPNDKDKYLTIYSNGDAPVFHLQTDQHEWLIDGRNGEIWKGSSEELFQNYTRIDGWNPSRSLKSSGINKLITKHLENTGCFNFNFRCSTLVDADYVVYISSKLRVTESSLFRSQEQEVLSIKYIDYSKIFQHLEKVLSGDEDYDFALINQESVRDAIAYAGQHSWRERYIDALRKLKESKRFYRFMKNLKEHPEIMSLPFVGNDSNIASLGGSLSSISYNYINMPREFSIAMCTLRAKNIAQKLLLDSQSTKNEKLEVFFSDCRDYFVFVNATFVNVAKGQSTLLATNLRKQSGYYSDALKMDILAHSCWLDEKSCVKTKRVKRFPRPSIAKIKNNFRVNKGIHKKPLVIVDLVEKNKADDSKPKMRVTHNDPNIVESTSSEPHLSATMENQLTPKTKVELIPDEAETDNLIFLSRPIGDVRDGKFMVKSFFNKWSTVPLSQGNYRVRVDLSINFEREDKCTKGVSCLFEQVRIRSKKASKSLVFYIGTNNDWSDERLVNFGSLVPLIADGASRYTSTLKKVRMVILSASFELN